MPINTDIVFLSHGGGPLPLLGDPGHSDLVRDLQSLSREIKRPSAVVMISAHWETQVTSITSGVSPQLIYDYAGFPNQAYDIHYPAPGHPALANALANALTESGIPTALDANRGFDHGMFVPLKILYPQGDIPCVQLSLDRSLDASVHLTLGHAMSRLQWDDLLVVGSGMSFHNLGGFFGADNDEANQKNQAFQRWLVQNITSTDLSESQRLSLLQGWQSAPYARFCHPREEHLLPLLVCYGMAQRASDRVFQTKVMNKMTSMFAWHR